MAGRLEFKAFWNAHPLNQSEQHPCRLPKDMVVNGRTLYRGLPSYHNQCAVRLGVALKGAGLLPGDLGNPRSCDFHDKSEMHILNATELADALTRAKIDGLGPVEKLVGGDPAQFYPKIFGRRGIVFFKDYWYRTIEQKAPDGGIIKAKEPNASGDHIDAWNGYRASSAWMMEWFSWLGYYSNYAESREIWFWEIT